MFYDIFKTLILIIWFGPILPERRFMHIDSTSASRRSAKRRIAVWTMESHSERTHHPAIRYISAQRAQHIFPGQCRCFRHVSTMARFPWQGQWVSQYYSVRGVWVVYVYDYGREKKNNTFPCFIGNKHWLPKSKLKRKVLWCRWRSRTIALSPRQNPAVRIHR